MRLIGFGRNAGNFLVHKMHYETKVNIKYTHTLIEDDIIINIVRDPLDSIVSRISMSQTIIFDIKRENYIEYATSELIPYYKMIYEVLLKSKSKVIFVKYEDINNTLLFDKLYQMLNLSKITHQKDFNFTESSKPIRNYQITSKYNQNYENIKNTLLNVDLSECYDLYYKALDRCIKLDNEI
jgi:hypothetical protein